MVYSLSHHCMVDNLDHHEWYIHDVMCSMNIDYFSACDIAE